MLGVHNTLLTYTLPRTVKVRESVDVETTRFARRLNVAGAVPIALPGRAKRASQQGAGAFSPAARKRASGPTLSARHVGQKSIEARILL